jgi:hypothetical protein
MNSIHQIIVEGFGAGFHTSTVSAARTLKVVPVKVDFRNLRNAILATFQAIV